MNREKEKLVPELRFPIFAKSGFWKDVKLIDITDKKKKWSFTGGPFGSNLKSSDYVEENEGVRIIQLQNIGDGEFKNDYKIYTSKEKADELLSCNIYPGDIIMSKMGDPVGRACLIPDYHNRYVMSSDGIRIAVDENIYDKYFIYLVLNSKVFRSKVENSSTGSTRKRIGLIDLKKLTLTIPKDKEEQQKIANCLFSLDNLITAETEKLDYLKEHKKGLLQQLFPAKGETKPRFRFPEFINDGDWELKKLSKLGKLINGLTYSPKDVRKQGLLVLRSSNVQSGQILLDDCVFVRADIKGANIAKPFDILICVRNGSKRLIGKNAIIPVGLPLSTHGAFMTMFRANNPSFVFQLFQTESYRNQVKADLGATINSINGKNFIKYEFTVPKNPKEQHKIANFLSSLDNLIESQSKKIETLKDHKNGLMQQLFPNLNDVVI